MTTPVDPPQGAPAAAGTLPSGLSPSRAGDFVQCPQLFKFRSIDRLPEPATTATARGTVVHAALDELYSHPAGARSAELVRQLITTAWDDLKTSDAGIAALLVDDDGATASDIVGAAQRLVDGYFVLEDPSLLEPAHRETRLETTLDSGLVLRGYVDRVDIAPTGQVRVVDYKTGKAPSPAFERKAMFQMLFYGLLWWRQFGRIPDRLQLLYLGNAAKLSHDPTERDLINVERKISAIWVAIVAANDTGNWQPRPSRLCDWCYHKKICPAWTDD